MKNNKNNIQSEITFSDKNRNINSTISNINIQKNDQQNTKTNLNNFDDDLNVSEINSLNETNNNIKRISIDAETLANQMKDLPGEIDNFDEDFENKEQNLSIEKNEPTHVINNNINDDHKKKITKEDLDNIPIPIFSCIYCSNEKIVFTHFSNEIISEKYLYQTSIYDIEVLNKLIYQPLIDKNEKNEKLLDIIIKNTEYLKGYHQSAVSIDFFKSNKYIDFCNLSKNKNHKLLIKRVEDIVVHRKKDFYFKGVNKIVSRNSNNKCLFNSTNSLINNCNALNGMCEQSPNINNNNTIISINLNSISMNNNELNNNILGNGIEKIEVNDNNEIDDKEDNDIINIFSFDSNNKIKITKKNVVWDNQYYDIWNPVFCDVNEKINIDKNEFKNKLSSKNKSFLCNKNNKKIDINKFYMDLKDNSNKNIKNNANNIKGHKKNIYYYSHFNNNKINNKEMLITVNNKSLYTKKNKYSKLNNSIANNSNTQIKNNKKLSSSCIKSSCSTTNTSGNTNKSLKFNYNEKLNINNLKYESSSKINKRNIKDFSIGFILKRNLIKSFNHSPDYKKFDKSNLNKSLSIKKINNSLNKKNMRKKDINNKSVIFESNIKIDNSLKYPGVNKNNNFNDFGKRVNIIKKRINKTNSIQDKNITYANKNNRDISKNKIKKTNYHLDIISYVNKNNKVNNTRKNKKVFKSPKLYFVS